MVFVKVTWWFTTKWKPGFLRVDQLRPERYGIWIPTKARDFLFSNNVHTAVGPTQPHIQWVPGFPRGGNSKRVVNFTTHFRQVPRWRMNAAIALIFLYNFVACVGTTVYFALYFVFAHFTVKCNTRALCSWVSVFRSWPGDLPNFRSPSG
jgi:hypothetical protein